MSLKKIEKITVIFNKIIELDKQIIEIEKMAIRLADNDDEVSLSIKNVPPKKTKHSINDQESARECLNRLVAENWHIPVGNSINDDLKNAFKFTIDLKLSVRETLEILGVIIKIKNEERLVLSKQLQILIPN